MPGSSAARNARRADSPSPEVNGNPVQQGLAVVADYIPSEALALFLGIYGVVTAVAPSPTEALRNAIVGIGAIAIPLSLALGFNFSIRSR